jgi:hypothetical protein
VLYHHLISVRYGSRVVVNVITCKVLKHVINVSILLSLNTLMNRRLPLNILQEGDMDNRL